MIRTPEFAPYQPKHACVWCAAVGPNFCPTVPAPDYYPRRIA